MNREGMYLISFSFNDQKVIIPDGHAAWLSKYYSEGQFYEQKMLAHIASVAQGGTFIDAGANAGNHTLFFALICGADRVHSFEPNKVSRSDLEKIITLNQVAPKVQIHPYALSDHTGTVEATYVIRQDQPNWSETVQCRRLDDVVTEQDVKVIKIDVEGAEHFVLMGATRILKDCRPRLYVEAEEPAHLDEIMSVVSPLGYHLTGQVFNASPTYEILPN